MCCVPLCPDRQDMYQCCVVCDCRREVCMHVALGGAVCRGVPVRLRGGRCATAAAEQQPCASVARPCVCSCLGGGGLWRLRMLRPVLTPVLRVCVRERVCVLGRVYDMFIDLVIPAVCSCGTFPLTP